MFGYLGDFVAHVLAAASGASWRNTQEIVVLETDSRLQEVYSGHTVLDILEGSRHMIEMSAAVPSTYERISRFS